MGLKRNQIIHFDSPKQSFCQCVDVTFSHKDAGEATSRRAGEDLLQPVRRSRLLSWLLYIFDWRERYHGSVSEILL